MLLLKRVDGACQLVVAIACAGGQHAGLLNGKGDQVGFVRKTRHGVDQFRMLGEDHMEHTGGGPALDAGNQHDGVILHPWAVSPKKVEV